MVHVLILDLKTDNGEEFFISSGASFHNLGPKLVIVSVTKMHCMHISIRYMCTNPKIVIFNFLKNKNFFHYFGREANFYFTDFCS